MNALQIFNFGNHEVRTVIIDNEPYFVGKDVASVLGYSNSRDALAKHVDDEDKGVAKCDTRGGKQDLVVINESGLYSLTLSSKLPKAKTFKRWVTSEVLPSIRKTGGYNLPKDFASALRAYALEVEENERLKEENKVLKPKAEFYDAVADSKTAIPMEQVAKVLGIKGIGRNKLFQLLRELKILQGNNMPYQTYIDRGYFRTIESQYTKPTGETVIYIKTLVFQKGIDFIRKKIKEV